MTIHHSTGEYSIELLGIAQAIANLPSRSVIVTDDNVNRLYGSLFPSGMPVLSVPAGEQSKSFETYRNILERLAESGADRNTSVVAVGGGVIGDLAGFAAATYMRGVPLIQIPTTLLAQVDSSVGGKVGIDMPQGKNLAGAFYPPKAVFIPIDSLATLEKRQFNNGMAEVWKYAFIADASLIPLLNGGNPQDLEQVVRRCMELKAHIVQEDEFERTGLRATLNFGHTVGHAIEHATGYGPILHGEAIAIGMVAEATLGERIGTTPSGTADTVRQCLTEQGLPTASELLHEPDALIQAMRRDKKAKQGSLAFSLLTGIGRCKLVESVPEADVRDALRTI